MEIDHWYYSNHHLYVYDWVAMTVDERAPVLEGMGWVRGTVINDMFIHDAKGQRLRFQPGRAHLSGVDYFDLHETLRILEEHHLLTTASSWDLIYAPRPVTLCYSL